MGQCNPEGPYGRKAGGQNQSMRYDNGSRGQGDTGPHAKECWQLLEAAKSKKIDSPQ